MNFVETMKTNARKLQRKLVLPEGTEPRMIAAAPATDR
jgi:phosphate acetyltransferase